MNRLHTDLSMFRHTVLQPAHGHVQPGTLREIDDFLYGLERKLRFAQIHLLLLVGVDWERVDGIGRCPPGAKRPRHLEIPLSEATLIIEHSDAAIDHVYLAFDGLIAALINMTDTMGRLLNVRYSIGLDPHKASLLSLKNHCSATSPLARVVNDPVHNDWLKQVRDLRGRCQHADVENVVMAPEGPYARRCEPFIPQDYSWHTPSQHIPITKYAEEAALAAEVTLVSVIAAIVSKPRNPFT